MKTLEDMLVADSLGDALQTVIEHERRVALRAHTFLTDQGVYVHTRIPADAIQGEVDIYEGDGQFLVLERGIIIEIGQF